MTAAPAPSSAAIDRRALILVAALAFLVSAPSLANGFAYDDRWIIVTNVRIHDFAHWSAWFVKSYWPTFDPSLYRPLTTTAFALQWIAGGGAPWIFHAVNVLLHVACAVAVARLAAELLPATAAIVVGALFAIDPVHVEAYANVVGQSELSAGLVMLVAITIYVRARRAGGPTRRDTLWLVALYAVAVTLKEHAFVLPAWFAVAEVTLFRDAAPWRARARQLASLFVWCGVVAAGALFARWLVLGALGGDTPHPVITDLGMRGRALVMLGVLPDLARLLVWPARLYADYSPMQVRVFATPDLSQLNGVVVVLGAFVLLAIAWRRSAVAAFALLIAAVVWLPTANVVFPSGILLSERTLFLPSAGVLIAVGTGLAWALRRFSAVNGARDGALAALGLVLVVGAVRSIDRDRVWRSSEDVFYSMVVDEPLSFKGHHAWGSVLMERNDLAGGERQWRMAMRIYPGYHQIYLDLARAYLQHHRCDAGLPLFEQARKLGGELPLVNAGIVACQLELARYRDAITTSRRAMLNDNDPPWFRARIYSADSALAKLDSVRK